jgi:hypothetical protein
MMWQLEDRGSWVAAPPYYNDPKSGKLIVHPAIQRGLWGDLYLQPSQYMRGAQVAPGAIIFGEGETRELRGYALTSHASICRTRMR